MGAGRKDAAGACRPFHMEDEMRRGQDPIHEDAIDSRKWVARGGDAACHPAGTAAGLDDHSLQAGARQGIDWQFGPGLSFFKLNPDLSFCNI